MRIHLRQGTPPASVNHGKWAQKLFSLALTLTLFSQSTLSAMGQTLQSVDPALDREPVKGGISIARDINVSNKNEKLSLNLRDVSIRDVLNLIAQQGNFNIILDDSVDGTLSVDINNVDLNKALEYIFTVGQLSYTKDGNTLIVATQESAAEKHLNAKTFKTIPVLYRDASAIAGQLNKTLFSIPRAGGNEKAIAAADPTSNSLLIMGSDEDIQMVNQALRELDIPRNRKVYQVRYNNPSTIAQILAANFFGFGAASATGAAGAGGAGAQGAQAAAPAGGGGAGGGIGGGAAAASGAAGLPVVAPSILNAGGVTFISETNSQTLTVLATEEQLALIDSAIQEVDVRRPQVTIEVALVELNDDVTRSLVPTFNTISLGSYKIQLLGGGTTNTIRWGGGPLLPKRFNISRDNNSSQAANTVRPYTLDNTDLTIRGKLLANPTIVAMDGTASSLNITDEVPTINSTTSLSAGVSVTTSTITKQQAGITMSITPTISNDGSVTLNVIPKVTQPLREIRIVSNGNVTSTVLLSERQLTVAAARVKDGETLVLGGLLREAQSDNVNKIPGLSDLPIVGAMMRASNTARKQRTELVLMITPHILKEEAITYFSQSDGIATSNHKNEINTGATRPLALPKFVNSSSSALNQQGMLTPPGTMKTAGEAASQTEPKKSGFQKISISGKDNTPLIPAKTPDFHKSTQSLKISSPAKAQPIIKDLPNSFEDPLR